MPTSSGSKVEATVGLGTENGVTSTPSIKSVKKHCLTFKKIKV